MRARGDRWRVVEARVFDGCQLITMAGAGACNHGVQRRLLAPFDSIELINSSSVQGRPRRVGPARWRRALRELLSRGLPGELRTVVHAGIDLLPYQLQPALAAVRGIGCRFLLADDVGLGKTIQAGAIVAELRARGAADRVLILTPPGLRDQWSQELLERFGIRADIVDFRAVRERVRALRSMVNPWGTWPMAIASVDYIKRPEVLRDIVACPWDVVVVDEAHRVANGGDRHDAVAALASHAAYVVLLTATPHNGDTRAFESLCGIGSHGERLLVFRRTRRALSSAVERRVHRLLVRASTDERRMHTRLTEFERAVRAERGDGNRDAWIALAVLRKRAFSSAHSLHLSITRRLDSMAPAPGTPAQLPLPLDEHGELDSADEPPAWQAVLALQDVDEERRLLTSLAAAATAAASRETKLAAIGRLLRRVREPLIIFTEYRDTLAHVAHSIPEPVAVLHGGLSRQERAAALLTFAERRRRILLATDAAGEGLNLHRICRIVINLELPWNPMRLEQRIGRVDRIGQQRRVHAFHLIAAGTGEERLLAELRERVAHAQTEIGAPDPLGGESPAQPEWPIHSELPDVSIELSDLRVLRALAPPIPFSMPLSGDDRPLLTRARHRSTRRCLGRRVLFIWEVGLEDRGGQSVAARTVAVATPLPTPDIDQVRLVESSSEQWRVQTAEIRRLFLDTRLARERAIEAAVQSEPRTGLQPGLFDDRAAHAHAAAQAAQSEAAAAIAERIVRLEASVAAETGRPRLRLVLLP